jgi:hypothetical protein
LNAAKKNVPVHEVTKINREMALCAVLVAAA